LRFREEKERVREDQRGRGRIREERGSERREGERGSERVREAHLEQPVKK
jgi:hypothetical protein